MGRHISGPQSSAGYSGISILLNKLISRYITHKDLEDFCGLYVGEYAFKQLEAFGKKLVKLSDL